jgi:hypothetical protein
MNLCYAGVLSYWDIFHLLHKWVKKKKIFDKTSNYNIGIYSEGLKTLAEVNAIKSSFQSHEKTIMEGICRLEKSRQYGCLIGLFVNSQHLKGLKERAIKVAQGGFLKSRENIKFSWGTIDKPESCELAASFYSKYLKPVEDVYLYLGYGSNKPALISHLWHANDLVFGNKENSQFTSRNVIGNHILQSFPWDSNQKYITYTLSIS